MRSGIRNTFSAEEVIWGHICRRSICIKFFVAFKYSILSIIENIEKIKFILSVYKIKIIKNKKHFVDVPHKCIILMLLNNFIFDTQIHIYIIHENVFHFLLLCSFLKLSRCLSSFYNLHFRHIFLRFLLAVYSRHFDMRIKNLVPHI